MEIKAQEIRQEDYPPNSNRYRSMVREEVTVEEKEEKKGPERIEKVVTTEVKRKKRGIGRRVADEILSDETPQSVFQYVLQEVLVPAAKNAIADMVTEGIQMLMFGDTKRSYNSGRKKEPYVSYNRYYQDRNEPRKKDPAPAYRRGSYHCDDIMFATRGEAEKVLDVLVDHIDDYGQVSVADLYDAVGMDSQYTDWKWGWTELGSARICHMREGYMIDTPRPKLLD